MAKSTLISQLIRPPKNNGERLQRLFKAHNELQRSYGQCYRTIKTALDHIRDVDTEETRDVAVLTEVERKKIEKQLLDSRTKVVLNYKRAIKKIEFAINELAPETFDYKDEPLQSDDIDWDKITGYMEDLAGFLFELGIAAGFLGLEPVAGAAMAASGFVAGVVGILNWAFD